MLHLKAQYVEEIGNTTFRDVNGVFNLFKLFSDALFAFVKDQPVSLKDRVSSMKRKTNLIGVPGKLNTTIDKFSKIIDDFYKSLFGTADFIETQISSSASSLISTYTDEYAPVIAEINDARNIIKSDTEKMNEVTQKHLTIIARLNVIVTGLARGTCNPKDTKEFHSNIPKLVKLRKKLTQQRNGFISSYNVAVELLRKAFSEVSSLSVKHYQILKEIFLVSSVLYREMGQSYLLFANKLLKSLQIMSFGSDMRDFAKRKSIVRYDPPDVPEFPYIDISGPAFMTVPIQPQTFRAPPQFPLGIVVAMGDFTPVGSNEIGIKAGQRMFLLESMKEKWTCVMNPLNYSIGFVPTGALQKVGKGLGVVIKEGGPIPQGMFVSIFFDLNQYLIVEGFDGKRQKISKEIVGILFL